MLDLILKVYDISIFREHGLHVMEIGKSVEIISIIVKYKVAIFIFLFYR